MYPSSYSELGASVCFFFSSRRRHTRFDCDWSSDVCSSDLFGGDIFKRSVTPVVIESVLRPRQAAWTAHHRNSLPQARGPLSRGRRSGQVKEIGRAHV